MYVMARAEGFLLDEGTKRARTHTHTQAHTVYMYLLSHTKTVELGAERQELTADSPCVFMMALMFNVSRSLMPSVEAMSEHTSV